MTEIKGIVVPLVTPFNADESVDEGALRTIVDYLIEAGVHGLFPSGSQGELYALSGDEKKRVMEVVIEQANGRAFVMPSTGAVTTRESIELTQYAQSVGADAVSVITPYFIQPSADEQIEHMTRISNSVSIPVLAYNNPGRTHVSFSPAMAAAVAQCAPNFVGIKDSSGDLTNTFDYMQRCPSGFRVFVGRDTLIHVALCAGCVGAVAATANVAPELVVGIYNAYQQGDLALSLELQHRLDPLRHAFSLGSFPVVVKDAMELLGLPAGRARAPIKSLEGAPREQLIAILKGMGKL
ncbi:MAG: 4-hydroxy-tetrahydrodipicolinate synthase [Anaerolineae bacterium]